MQIAILELDNGLTLQVLDSATSDIPLLGYRPVEDLSSRWNLTDLHLRYYLPDHLQRLTKAVASDATTNGEESSRQFVHISTCVAHCKPVISLLLLFES